jgi:hypothetical protein
MSTEKVPLDAVAKLFLAIPALHRAAIISQKMRPPAELFVTDSGGTVLYQEKV